MSSISGTWETPDGDQIVLLFDGRSAVTGTVTAGRRDNIAAISRGTFDPATRLLTIEGTARHPNTGAEVPYAIEGRLVGRRLVARVCFGADRGDATLRKATLWFRIARRLQRLRPALERRLQPLIVPWVRRRRAALRYSAAENRQRLNARGETLDSFTFRDAVAADIPKLAALHVKTWAATYPEVGRPPTFAIRESQWQQAFAKDDDSWFCVVIEAPERELIGFAKGIVHGNYSGDLNKIYLLWEYHRLGLGRRLVGHVVRRFLERGVTSMTLMADAANPSCAFYEAIAGEVQRDDQGRPQPGAYIWRDLERLAVICPIGPQ